MEVLRLVRPSIEYKEQALEYIQEHIEANSNINGVGGLKRYLDDYEGWLLKLEEDYVRVPSNEKVPAETYFLVRESDNRIIGMCNLRLSLNDNLIKLGGHIGYGIRPSERQKGYNKINLYLALKRYQELGIPEVILDCDKDNPASYKTMEALGGKLIKEFYSEEEGCDCLRYKINVLEAIRDYQGIYEGEIIKRGV